MPNPQPIHTTSILNDMRRGELTPMSAIEKCESIGNSGMLMLAGNIALRTAFTEPSDITTLALIDNAQQDYSRVIENRGRHEILARCHKGQIPIYALLAQHSMPGLDIVAEAYKETLRSVKTGIDRAASGYRVGDHDHTRIMVNKVGIHLLLQHYAIEQLGCDEWLPVLSDYGGDSVAYSDPSNDSLYDISILIDDIRVPDYRIKTLLYNPESKDTEREEALRLRDLRRDIIRFNTWGTLKREGNYLINELHKARSDNPSTRERDDARARMTERAEDTVDKFDQLYAAV